MTDEQRDRVADLARDKERKRQRYEHLGRMNTAMLPPEQRREEAAAYAIAEAEYYEAASLLSAAVRLQP